MILPPVCDVSAGPFLMGSDPAMDTNVNPDEYSQHWVMGGTFQIGQHPVTVAEYACFIRFTGRPAPSGEEYGVSWRTQVRAWLDHPVVMVSGLDAAAYAEWLAERTGQSWRLQQKPSGRRLPLGCDYREMVPLSVGDRFDSTAAIPVKAK